MNSQPLPVLHSVAAAYAFLISHWRKLAIAAAPYTVIYAAQLYLMIAFAGSEMPPALGASILLLSILTVITSLALSASSLRMAVLGDYSGRFGLKFGADEGRLFVVSLLVSALTVLVFIMVFMFWAVVLGSVATAALQQAGVDPEAEGFILTDAFAYLGTADWVAVWGVGLLAGALVIWLTSRLVLAFPATIDAKRIQVLSVWSLSGGQAWRIAGALLLTSLPLIAVEFAVYEALCALAGDRLFHMPLELGPDGLPSPGQERVQEYVRWHGLLAFVNIPLFSGLYAYIYRRLKPPPVSA